MPRDGSTPRRPGEHAVQPVKPVSAEGHVLGRVAENLRRDFDRLFDGMSEAGKDRLRGLTNIAREYSYDLNRYWVYTRGSARDRYVYGKQAEPGWLEKVGGSLDEVDKKMEKQLSEWAQVTSPYLDHYELEKIYDAAHELRKTVEGSLEKLRLNFGSSAADMAKDGYVLQITSALAGIAEQVSSQLGALAAGKTVEPVTINRQTQELIDRNGKDNTADRLLTEAAKATSIAETALLNYSEASILDLWKTRLETSLKLKQKDLPPAEREVLAERRDAAEDVLAALDTAFTRADIGAKHLQAIKAASANVWTEYFSITSGKNADTSDKRIQAFFDQAKALASMQATHSQEVGRRVTEQAEAAEQRANNYQQIFKDGKTAARRDLDGYWRKVKSTLLESAETVSGKELKTILDKAFDADLSKAVKDWRAEAERRRPDAEKLQRLTNDLAATIGRYSERSSAAITAEVKAAADVDVAKALEQAGDEAQAGLAALRDEIVSQMKTLFDNGVFDLGG